MKNLFIKINLLLFILFASLGLNLFALQWNCLCYTKSGKYKYIKTDIKTKPKKKISIPEVCQKVCKKKGYTHRK